MIRSRFLEQALPPSAKGQGLPSAARRSARAASSTKPVSTGGRSWDDMGSVHGAQQVGRTPRALSIVTYAAQALYICIVFANCGIVSTCIKCLFGRVEYSRYLWLIHPVANELRPPIKRSKPHIAVVVGCCRKCLPAERS